jgi:hypothetical protein
MRDAARRAVAMFMPWPQSHWSVSRSRLRTSSPAAYAQPLVDRRWPWRDSADRRFFQWLLQVVQCRDVCFFSRGRKLVQPIVPRASRAVCGRGFSSSGSSVCRICVEVWVP